MATQNDKQNDKQLEKECDHLLAWIRSLDPTWDSNAAAAIAENGWTARQALGAWVGHVLENDMHMSIPQHPMFEPGVPSYTALAPCLACGTEFRVSFPGERVCSNLCAARFRQLEQAAKAMAAAEQHDTAPTDL